MSVEDAAEFENNLKATVQASAKPAVKAPGRPDHVQEVNSLEEFQQVVAEEPDKLVVVRFYAPWCRVRFPSKPSTFERAGTTSFAHTSLSLISNRLANK